MAHRVVTRSNRKSVWLQFAHVRTTNAGSSSTVAFSLNAAALALRPFTVVRSHFSFFLSSDQAAAEETQSCVWGAAVVSDQAVTVGITAVPLPNTDLGSSLWFAIKGMYSKASSLTDRATPGVAYSLDSKAMRKVDVGSDIVVVLQNPAAEGWEFSQVGRILVKTN